MDHALKAKRRPPQPAAALASFECVQSAGASIFGTRPLQNNLMLMRSEPMIVISAERHARLLVDDPYRSGAVGVMEIAAAGARLVWSSNAKSQDGNQGGNQDGNGEQNAHVTRTPGAENSRAFYTRLLCCLVLSPSNINRPALKASDFPASFSVHFELREGLDVKVNRHAALPGKTCRVEPRIPRTL